MKYAVVIERGRRVTGRMCRICRGAWRSRRPRQVCALIGEAIELYLEALEEDGRSGNAG